jgi:multisubunit Na+/H+ antiporter MnhG subunit
MKIVKRRFSLVLGIVFSLLGAFLFMGSLLVGLLNLDPAHRWIAMEEFGGIGLMIVIAGAAMCFEKN